MANPYPSDPQIPDAKIMGFLVHQHGAVRQFMDEFFEQYEEQILSAPWDRRMTILREVRDACQRAIVHLLEEATDPRETQEGSRAMVLPDRTVLYLDEPDQDIEGTLVVLPSSRVAHAAASTWSGPV